MSAQARACYRFHRQFFRRGQCRDFVLSVARRAADGDEVAIGFLARFPVGRSE